ncbi:hypothetical protein [Bacteroides sp.]|uniref:hypothetical protein n=1 Tax=Bacteroides sp. TaxID=29523 RepID=UPI003A91B603
MAMKILNQFIDDFVGVFQYRFMDTFQLNPEKPDVPLNKNDAFQKVQKRRVQEKR